MFNSAMFVKVINAHLSLKVWQHNITSPDKAYHMDTFVMTHMWKGNMKSSRCPAHFNALLFCILLLVLMPILFWLCVNLCYWYILKVFISKV